MALRTFGGISGFVEEGGARRDHGVPPAPIDRPLNDAKGTVSSPSHRGLKRSETILDLLDWVPESLSEFVQGHPPPHMTNKVPSKTASSGTSVMQPSSIDDRTGRL